MSVGPQLTSVAPRAPGEYWDNRDRTAVRERRRRALFCGV